MSPPPLPNHLRAAHAPSGAAYQGRLLASPADTKGDNKAMAWDARDFHTANLHALGRSCGEEEEEEKEEKKKKKKKKSRFVEPFVLFYVLHCFAGARAIKHARSDGGFPRWG